MINNSDSESESVSMFSESVDSVDHCLEVQDEIINQLREQIKQLHITIELLKKLCKVTWSNDAYNGIRMFIISK